MAIKKILLPLVIFGATSIALASPEGSTDAVKKYSPMANTEHATNVYWGDSHLHTGLSLDAGLFGNTLEPDDAYRLARGEKITASSGTPVQLSRPLDWLIVTNHSIKINSRP